MAASANYAATPNIASAVVSAANTARDGTGTIVSVFTAAATGSRVDRIIVKATGTITAGCVTIFLSDGTNMRIIDEITFGAVTASATVASARQEVNSVPIVLRPGWSVRAATTVAQSFVVTVIGGDF